MPKATNTPTTSRRGLLAGSGVGAILAGIGLPVGARASALETSPTSANDPDAALIAACAAFLEAHRLYDACNDPSNRISEDEGDRRHDIWHETLDVVTEMPATTPDGLRAKAKAMIAAFEMDIPNQVHDTVEDSAGYAELLAWRLAHDLIALGGSVVA